MDLRHHLRVAMFRPDMHVHTQGLHIHTHALTSQTLPNPRAHPHPSLSPLRSFVLPHLVARRIKRVQRLAQVVGRRRRLDVVSGVFWNLRDVTRRRRLNRCLVCVCVCVCACLFCCVTYSVAYLCQGEEREGGWEGGSEKERECV